LICRSTARGVLGSEVAKDPHRKIVKGAMKKIKLILQQLYILFMLLDILSAPCFRGSSMTRSNIGSIIDDNKHLNRFYGIRDVIGDFDIEICKCLWNGHKFVMPNPQFTFRKCSALTESREVRTYMECIARESSRSLTRRIVGSILLVPLFCGLSVTTTLLPWALSMTRSTIGLDRSCRSLTSAGYIQDKKHHWIDLVGPLIPWAIHDKKHHWIDLVGPLIRWAIHDKKHHWIDLVGPLLPRAIHDKKHHWIDLVGPLLPRAIHDKKHHWIDLVIPLP